MQYIVNPFSGSLIPVDSGFNIIQTDVGTYPAAENKIDALSITSSDNSIVVSGNASNKMIDLVYNSPSLVASYYAANSSQDLAGTGTIVQFNNKIEDDLNCVTTGVNWSLTIPSGLSGVYQFDTYVTFASGQLNQGDHTEIWIQKNNELYKPLGCLLDVNANKDHSTVHGNGVVRLSDGDSISIVVSTEKTVSTLLNTSTIQTYIDVVKL